MKKDHYYQLGLKTLALIKDQRPKPKLLLHSCCAPCNCYPMLYLHEYFDMTLYFNNNNIYPYNEYQLRLDELIKYTDDFNLQHQANIKIITTTYDNETFNKSLEPYKDYPERSNRCWLCYELRMSEAYQYADDHHFDYFTTVMTISRHKDAEVLNQIGERLALQHQSVKYFHSDLKKGGGSDNSVALVKSLDLYRQQYCGCLYSYRDMLKRKSQKSTSLHKNDDII